jgi:LysR family transcriptional regulator, low CO2-responsive transcriptional regulator
MTFTQLRTFLAVARHHGISHATRELALTQSAVSRQILNLEASLGVQLFVRRGRRLVLTEAGQTLEDHARRAAQVMTDARNAIDGLKGLVRGRLRIAAASTIGIYVLPRVLGDFKVRYPGVEVSLSITNKEQVMRGLLGAAWELGFVGPPVPFPELALEEYVRDEMVLIVSPRHALAGRASVAARQLEREAFIMREQGSGTREVIEREMRRARVPLRAAMEFGSTEAVKEAVAANLGVSVVSAHAVTQEVKLGRLRTARIADLNLRHAFCLLYLKNVPLSPAATVFRRVLFERATPRGGATRRVRSRKGRT